MTTRAAAVTNCYIGATGALNVEAAITSPRVFYQDVLSAAFAATVYNQYVVDKWWNSFIPIIGPVSVCFYFQGNTTAPQGYFSWMVSSNGVHQRRAKMSETLYEFGRPPCSLWRRQHPANPQLRMGIPAQAGPWNLFALMCRMYNAHQAVVGMAIAMAAPAVGAIVLTAPCFWLHGRPRATRCSASPQCVLRHSGNDRQLSLPSSTLRRDSFDATSAGAAVVPLNWRNDNPRSSIVTNCWVGPSATDLVEALTRVRALYQDVIPVEFAATTICNYVVDKWWNDLIPIVGPASVLLYAAGATASGTGYFSLMAKWRP